MADGWDRLPAAANAVQNGREISPFVSAGQVAAALETASGKIYVGVCVDAACGWGTCAERVAIDVYKRQSTFSGKSPERRCPNRE